ncbi:hypothetical protein E2C01_004678 [Portunus trituberculatus]|uniref:Uncharacterized protein n=1 Tax=Portunus trituberculatus TaxID=210409 RepID=A0A5B7CQL6_PORTR|nr:hypothetical protein [Portunus trituberculatus]
MQFTILEKFASINCSLNEVKFYLFHNLAQHDTRLCCLVTPAASQTHTPMGEGNKESADWE